MRAGRVSDERGIALAVAIFALVVIGALVAGTFYAGRLEQQTGRNTFMAAQAAEAAEAGLKDAIVTQTATGLLALNVDDDLSGGGTKLTDLKIGGSTVVERKINRLTENVFLVRSLATRANPSGGQLASRSIGQLIRLMQADININAGLTALGDVAITGGAEVTGLDGVPPTWVDPDVDCPPLGNVTGVRHNDGKLTITGAGAIGGQPDSILDPTLNTTDMKETFNKLKVLATLIVNNPNPPATVPAYTATVPPRCDTKVEFNWGEPMVPDDPCFDYFPIIYHYGNLKLQGGRGQGMLLVEGDLTASGGMVFFGPVMVTGTLSTTGNSGQGAKFYGGVIAGNVALDDLSKLAGGALVSYSSCAIHRALQNSATIGTLAERSWVQLYN